MSIEKEYVLNSFMKNFSAYKEKKLVLYGLGENTKLLLERFPAYHFVGLMDGVRTGEVIWGLPVLTCEEAKQMGAGAILIIARTANVPIIYHRIAGTCDRLAIPVFDINGQKLSLHKRNSSAANDTAHGKKEELYRKIDRCQIISFDIFDTVLMRKTLIPTDIFVLTEKKMKDNGCHFPCAGERRKAELELLGEGKQPELADIYRRMELHFPGAVQPDQWMKAEIDTEKENILAREEMKEALIYAGKQGKQVFFTSDMYLSADILAELLNGEGVPARPEQVIVSCQYGVSKAGGLYAILRNRFPGERILHVGDNSEADGQYAKEAGIDEVFLLQSAYALLEKSEAWGLLKFSDSLENRMIIGEFAAKQFENPFVFEETAGKIKLDKEYDVGRYILAPILSVFIRWLIQKSEEYKLERLLLPSRDGYIIKKLLDLVHKLHPSIHLPEYTYFYTSRLVCVRAAIRGEADIRYAALQVPFSGTPEVLLRQRFGLEEAEILKRGAEEMDISFVLRHQEAILKHARETRVRYEWYLTRLKIRDTERCGFFDFASRGTCQYAFGKFWNVKLKGLYFLAFHNPANQKMDMDGLYCEENLYRSTSAAEEKYFLLERIMTSFEPTLTGFDEEGTPMFGEESRPREELEALLEIHRGIIDGFAVREIHRSILNGFAMCDFGEKNMADEFIRLLDEEHAICSLPFFKSSYTEDLFCNRSFTVPGF